MAEESSISWTDASWNPWLGCDKVSAECRNCYIDRVLRRLGVKAWGDVQRAASTWTLPLEIQKKAVRDGKRYKVFTCSLSDFFHEKADPWRPEAWRIMSRCPDVDFLVLTKRPDRIVQHLPADWGASGWPNVWLGVSAGVRKSLWRVTELRKIPAAIRFISAEPLLESLQGLDLEGIHWLIAGGESGPGFRPMETSWAEELRNACAAAGVAFFFKQASGIHSGMQPELLGKLYHSWPAGAVGVRNLFAGL